MRLVTGPEPGRRHPGSGGASRLPKSGTPVENLGSGPALPRFPAQVVGCSPHSRPWRPPAERSESVGRWVTVAVSLGPPRPLVK